MVQEHLDLGDGPDRASGTGGRTDWKYPTGFSRHCKCRSHLIRALGAFLIQSDFGNPVRFGSRMLEPLSMLEHIRLRPLVEWPTESPSVEYKDWLDLTVHHGRATLAKHVIALANYGGGYIVLGFAEVGSSLQSHARPDDVPEATPDAVNEAVRRYADPEIQCQMRSIPHPETGVEHPVIDVPGGFSAPVLCRRDYEGVLRQSRCYIRKPGPRSEEPRTYAEWRSLIDRCVRNARNDMLDSIRSIVSGEVEAIDPVSNAQDDLEQYCVGARGRWEEVVSDLPGDSHARFPLGYHEIGVSLVGAVPAGGLNELRRRLDEARDATAFSGWPLFLNLDRTSMAQRIHGDFIEAWVGQPMPDRWLDGPAHSDYWRVSPGGHLYSIRGYLEDDMLQNVIAGVCLDLAVTAQRVAEALIFAKSLAEAFGHIQQFAFRCRFTGLDGRRVVSLRGRSTWRQVCRTDVVELLGQATPQQVDDNLAEVVHRFLLPLYERFEFYELPFSAVQRALQEMRH